MSESIIERIVRLIDEKCLKDKDFCDKSGISQSTFATWKQRKSDPKASLIPQIAIALNVSENYLLTGDEDAQMYYVEAMGLSDVYLSLAKEAQKNSIAPEDIRMAIKMIQEIRERENKSK